MTQIITFDGTDVDKGGEWIATPFINVWKRYNPKDEIVATVAHGSSGELLQTKGAVCKVRVGDAVGYLTYWFIKELKDGFLEARRKEAVVEGGYHRVHVRARLRARCGGGR